MRRQVVDHTLPFRQSGDILLILPPFAEVNRPSLGLTLLQQIAAEEGLSCEIYYATLHLARAFDEKIYIAAAIETNGLPLGLPLLGERLFSSFAFPELEFDNRIYAEYEAKHRHGLPAGQSRFPALEATIGVW